MKFLTTLEKRPAGGWTARHTSADVGEVQASEETREAALEKLVGEIRYRLELCPCSGDSYQHIEVEIVEAPPQHHRAS